MLDRTLTTVLDSLGESELREVAFEVSERLVQIQMRRLEDAWLEATLQAGDAFPGYSVEDAPTPCNRHGYSVKV